MRVGVLGGGQLGRMLALAARPLDVAVRCLDPAPDAPASSVGEFVHADFGDTGALDRFCAGLDVATFEFENVPLATVEHVASRVPFAPSARSLRVGQDRALEKELFRSLGIPSAVWAVARTDSDIAAAADEVGLPAVVKTCRLGYDGKGQRTVRAGDPRGAIASAWAELGRVPVLVERLVEFTFEASGIVARDRSGKRVSYAPARNVHERAVLRESVVDGSMDPALAHDIIDRTSAVADALGHVGVRAVEFFVRREDGRWILLANELAPRVHNSGHWTIDGALTSQFENHVRAVCGLPLGPTGEHGPCAMLNLIGGLPPPASLLAVPGAKLHLYGKQARPGRKLGHVNLTAPTPEACHAGVERLRAIIAPFTR